jgi:hypothetical protein
MCKLIPGKLYKVNSKTSFIYGDVNPYSDSEDTSVLIENNSIVVYLETVHTKRQWLFMNTEEDLYHFKILFNDRLLYILDDGACRFTEIKHI